MILLDTDMMTTLHAPPSSVRELVVRRLEAADAAGDEVAVSVISFEEQMRGWMAVISRARDAAGQVPAYGHLRRLFDQYHEMHVLDFDAVVAAQFQALRVAHRRANTMDLKIAAVAIAHGAVLLSGNARDFAAISELRFEPFRP